VSNAESRTPSSASRNNAERVHDLPQKTRVIGLQLTIGAHCREPAHKSEPQFFTIIRFWTANWDFRRIIRADRWRDEGITGEVHDAAKIAEELGFDFVDIKHSMDIWTRNSSARTRAREVRRDLDNRTRFLREIVHTIRVIARS